MDDFQTCFNDADIVFVTPVYEAGEDPIGPTRVLLDRIAQLNQSTLQKLHVIGSFENVPGSRFEDLGPWTTFVYAEFDNWNQYWNIIWSSDGTYWKKRASGSTRRSGNRGPAHRRVAPGRHSHWSRRQRESTKLFGKNPPGTPSNFTSKMNAS